MEPAGWPDGGARGWREAGRLPSGAGVARDRPGATGTDPGPISSPSTRGERSGSEVELELLGFTRVQLSLLFSPGRFCGPGSTSFVT